MEPQAPAPLPTPEQQSRRPHGLGTLLYVPVLYGVGWLTARPLQWLAPGLRPDQLDLAGLVVALLLLLVSLPWRLRRSWGATHPWRRLGVVATPLVAVRAFLGGLAKAALLLAVVAAVLLASGQAVWQLDLKAGELLNALALLLGVGFAEELLFRGWLWGELALQLSRRRALLLQAALFALVHPWYRAGNPGAIGLLGGLILLGLALALQRRSDGGVLWGAIGLHGGLVGGWFVLQTGLLQLAPEAPAWLVGPGGEVPNPIGGLIGWLGLALVLLACRPAWMAPPRNAADCP